MLARGSSVDGAAVGTPFLPAVAALAARWRGENARAWNAGSSRSGESMAPRCWSSNERRGRLVHLGARAGAVAWGGDGAAVSWRKRGVFL